MNLMKKKVVIFANCQSGAIGQTLSESDMFTKDYSWEFNPPVQSIKTDAQIQSLISSVESADVFIYQNVNAESYPKEVNTNFLLERLNPKCVKISIPSMYFDGYFPHLSTMAGKTGPLNLVHDYFIASAYVLGSSKKEAKDMILSESLYDVDFSKELANTSLENLSKREKEVDITIGGYILENYKKRQLFNQFNHPRREVIVYVCRRVLTKLNIASDSLSDVGGGYLDAIATPVYKSTIKALNLDFDSDGSYSGAGGKLELDEVISRFWTLYDNLGKDFVLSQVKNKKPFILSRAASFLGKDMPKLLDLKNISFDDIKTPEHVDFLRDEAVKIENEDLEKALQLMSLAHRARPQGPFIKKKLAEYEKALSEQSKTN